MTKKEALILKEVLLALSDKFYPGLFWRQNAGKIRTDKGSWIELGPVGIADIVGFIQTPWGAQQVFVETKTLKGKQRESQKNWQAAVERAGAIYVVARSPEEAIEDIYDKIGLHLPTHERMKLLTAIRSKKVA